MTTIDVPYVGGPIDGQVRPAPTTKDGTPPARRVVRARDALHAYQAELLGGPDGPWWRYQWTGPVA